MPHKKGRARDTVPQKYNRTSKKAAPGPATSSVALADVVKVVGSVRLASDLGECNEDKLPLPLELWLRVARLAGPVELCRGEMMSRATRSAVMVHREPLWEALCELDFPSMWCSLKKSGATSSYSTPVQRPSQSMLSPPVSPDLMPSTLLPQPSEAECEECSELPAAALQRDETPISLMHDWKVCYVRRLMKQRAWDAARGRTRSQSDASDCRASAPSSKGCVVCGEHFTHWPTGKRSSECISHPGDFLPRSSLPGRTLEHLDMSASSTDLTWSRAELSQLQILVRAAWRSAGGSSGVCQNARNFRGGGHWAKYMGFKGWGSRGHWAEGCGARPGSSLLRDCIDGKVPCSWSCCGSEELISRGCNVTDHR